MNAKDYVQVFKKIYEELADMKLTAKARVEISGLILQELGKDSRTPNFEEQKEIVIKDPNAPATQSQIDTLKKLGLKTIPAGLLKGEASIMISENIKNKKQIKETVL